MADHDIYGSLRQAALDILPPILSRGISNNIVKKFQARTGAHTRSVPLRRISTHEALDEVIHEADTAQSDDELRRVLASFEYVDNRPVPPDPFSTAYHEAAMRLYQDISGREGYTPVRDEVTPFDVEAAKRVAFPFSTKSCTTVGEQLSLQGFTIKHMNLRPGGRVIEFGPGWGNTTLALAQMGQHVCAVDVFQGFLDLIDHRAKQASVRIELHQADMLDFTTGDKADAVLFFESFHHCSDHQRMLGQLHNLVKEDGIVVFGGEPISAVTKPWPWGPRLDGQAVWSMRKFGWLEMGFMPGYFLEALKHYGWRGRLTFSHDCPWQSVVVAKKAVGNAR